MLNTCKSSNPSDVPQTMFKRQVPLVCVEPECGGPDLSNCCC
jgi:hypothetical protein